MKIEHIVIHCSDSEWGSASVIRQWHLARGWKDIGYSLVISNGKPFAGFKDKWEFMDGSVEAGRQLNDNEFIEPNEVQAAALGYNDSAINICLIGKYFFTRAQLWTLQDVVHELQNKFDIPTENILGHYETKHANGKTCPNIPMSTLREFIDDRTGAGELQYQIKMHNEQ